MISGVGVHGGSVGGGGGWPAVVVMAMVVVVVLAAVVAVSLEGELELAILAEAARVEMAKVVETAGLPVALWVAGTAGHAEDSGEERVGVGTQAADSSLPQIGSCAQMDRSNKYRTSLQRGFG